MVTSNCQLYHLSTTSARVRKGVICRHFCQFPFISILLHRFAEEMHHPTSIKKQQQMVREHTTVHQTLVMIQHGEIRVRPSCKRRDVMPAPIKACCGTLFIFNDSVLNLQKITPQDTESTASGFFRRTINKTETQRF